jgi:hypothetical protein
MNLAGNFEYENIAPLHLFRRLGKRKTQITNPIDVHRSAVNSNRQVVRGGRIATITLVITTPKHIPDASNSRTSPV